MECSLELYFAKDFAEISNDSTIPIKVYNSQLDYSTVRKNQRKK